MSKALQDKFNWQVPKQLPNGFWVGSSKTRQASALQAYGDLNCATHVGDCPNRVALNRQCLFESLCQELQIQAVKLQWMQQTHETQCIYVSGESPSTIANTDAIWTDSQGIALIVQHADCVPIIMIDTVNHRLAAIHAGWRGVAGNIIGKVLTAITQANSVWHAYIGPHISQQCFEIQNTLLANFDESMLVQDALHENSQGQLFLSLSTLVQHQLKAHGVRVIEAYGGCTMTDEGYFSYRRQAQTGRNLTIVSMRSPALI